MGLSYKKILFCLDNSDYANAGVDAGLMIARESGAQVSGCHVYAARLHSDRFTQMEGGLPAEYQREEELARQRETHSTLISKGLEMISDSYMTVLREKARSFRIVPKEVSREGKNYDELVKEARDGGYGLVVMGAHGLGKTEKSRIGSVCERAVRRISSDILVMKDSFFSGSADGPVLAAIDGSPRSFAAFLKALELSRIFKTSLEVVSAYDPDFHYAAFRSISGVLSDEAGRVFRFKEQEKLHEEIIDKGLARIYQGHIDTALRLAGERGFEKIGFSLLSGKPFNAILDHIEKKKPFLLVMGKTGFHAAPGLDIGSTTENCLREAGCNIFFCDDEFRPAEKNRTRGVSWSKDALAALEKIPAFARAIAKNMIEDEAAEQGMREITPEFMRKVRDKVRP